MTTVTAEEILADTKARVEQRRAAIKLSTACVVCGEICTGARPTDYALVDPDDQAGKRVHTACMESMR